MEKSIVIIVGLTLALIDKRGGKNSFLRVYFHPPDSGYAHAVITTCRQNLWAFAVCVCLCVLIVQSRPSLRWNASFVVLVQSWPHLTSCLEISTLKEEFKTLRENREEYLLICTFLF